MPEWDEEKWTLADSDWVRLSGSYSDLEGQRRTLKGGAVELGSGPSRGGIHLDVSSCTLYTGRLVRMSSPGFIASQMVTEHRE